MDTLSESYSHGVVMKWGGTSLVTARQDLAALEQLVTAFNGVPSDGYTIGVFSGQGKIDDTPQGKKATDHMYDIANGKNPQQAWGIFYENTEKNMQEHGLPDEARIGIDLLLERGKKVLESGNLTSQAKAILIGLPERVKTAILYEVAQRAYPETSFFTPHSHLGMIGDLDDQQYASLSTLSFIDVPIDEEASIHNLKKFSPFVKGKVALIPGFVGHSRCNDRLVTLERGSSDATATYWGTALGVDEIIIYSDQSGILPVDPSVVSGLEALADLSYREARVFAGLGAKIIQQVAIRPAEKYRIPISIRPSNLSGRGTKIGVCSPSLEHCGVKAIARESNYALVLVTGFHERVGEAAQVDQLFAEAGINVAHLNDGTDCRRYVVTPHNLYGPFLEKLGDNGRTIQVDYPFSRITLVGEGINLYQKLYPQTGARTKFIDTLQLNAIPTPLYSRDSSDIGLSAFIPGAHEGLALRKLADVFGFTRNGSQP